jgi:hypothetical protein
MTMKSFSRLIMLVAASVSVLLLVVSYFFFTGFSSYMLQNAAVKQADTIAQLTFSSMYQLMSKGWNREQVIEFADHAAASVANTPTRISFYRAEPVSRQFGEIKDQQPADEELQIALRSGRSRQVDRDGGLTYHMPLVAQDNCLRCHTQAKRGEVMGAITVHAEFGEDMKKTSLHMLLVLMLFAPAPFIAALMVAIHLDHRFDDFGHGIEEVAAAIKAGKPADFSRVPTRYDEFQHLLERVKKLFG